MSAINKKKPKISHKNLFGQVIKSGKWKKQLFIYGITLVILLIMYVAGVTLMHSSKNTHLSHPITAKKLSERISTQVSQNSLQNSSSGHSITPTAEPAYPEQLIWIAYNLSYGQMQFSTEIPYPGPYCSGCYDGEGGVTNMTEEHVSGGSFTNDSPSAMSDWFLESAIFKNGDAVPQGYPLYFDVPSGKLYETLSQEKIGSSFYVYDNTNKAYSTTRLPDRYIDGTEFLLFQISFSPPESIWGYTTSSEAFTIFQRNGLTGLLSFQYGNNLYRGVFEHMLDAFSFTKRPATVGVIDNHSLSP